MQKYIEQVEKLWQERATITSDTAGHEIVLEILDMLDKGKIRTCIKCERGWVVNEWVKKAILLFFRLNQSKTIQADYYSWYDKVPLKFQEFTDDSFLAMGSRFVPGSYVRRGAYIGKNVVIMPSFVNTGAYIDDGTMIDSWATIGSCAQVGKNCHISMGAGIGGVLEPLQATPVIIEDGCFIGAGAQIAEGVIVEEGAVIAMGVNLGGSTKIYDIETKEIAYGRVPPFSVVVPGHLPATKNSGVSLYCAVIIKKVDARTRAKTSINELIR